MNGFIIIWICIFNIVSEIIVCQIQSRPIRRPHIVTVVYLSRWQFVLSKVIFIFLNLQLNQLQDIFDILKTLFRIIHLLLHTIYSFSVLFIKVLEGLDQFFILKGNKRFLKDLEVKLISLCNVIISYFIWKSSKHQQDV